MSGLPFVPGVQFLPRGKSYQLLVAGSNLGSSSNFKFSAPSSDITPQGGTIVTTATLGGLPILQQNITISSTAALGPSSYSLSDAASTSAIPGGIAVTVNPQINPSVIRDTAGYGTKLSPGAIFYIEGTDLANKEDEWTGPNPAGPTTLGGVSVKITDSNNVDRFAPLLHVFPGKMTGLIPYEIAGTSAKMTIVAGPNAVGNTVTFSLTPTSPGLIFANACGDPCGAPFFAQGAILNGAELSQGIGGSFAASTGTPIGTAPAHPAKSGGVVAIYAVGLGPITSAAPGSPVYSSGCLSAVLPSGIGSASKDTAGNTTCVQVPVTNPTVVIGGQTVDPAKDPNFAVFLVPGFVGLFQVNVTVPANVSPDSSVPVQVVAQGNTSNTVTMAVTAP